MSPTLHVFDVNFTLFVQKFERAVIEGYELDPSTLPGQFGCLYEAFLVLNDERAGVHVPKPTRAEILAKAREAKAAKGKEAVQ